MPMIEDEELRGIYQATSSEHLQILESGLLHLEKHPDDRDTFDSLLRSAHTLKGDSRMVGVDGVETLMHHFEELLKGIQAGRTSLDATVSDRLYRGLDATRQLVREGITGEPSGVNLFAVLAGFLGADDEPATEEEFDFGDEALWEVEEEVQKTPVATQTLPVAPKTANTSVDRLDTIRVDTQRLDTLMTHAGELTVARARLSRRVKDLDAIASVWQHWQRLQRPGVSGNSSLAGERGWEQLGRLLQQVRREAAEDSARLESVAYHLGENIRSLRLLPLSTIFNLYERTVRDLAKQQGKQVQWVVVGGEVLVDKRIIEEMKDPLLHAIRNAIDPGIETPEERVRAGKPERATIRLQGMSAGSHVVLEITDDGRGLDEERIEETALRRGIKSASELAQMSREQLYHLIFAPGFSTRDVASTVSGRGVGLDVVRANVEALDGSIRVLSEPGRGCTFRIQLPASLATVRVLLVEIHGNPYGIPIDSVAAIVAIAEADLFNFEGAPAMNWQGSPIAVVRLARVLELEGSTGGTARYPGIILQNGEAKVAFIVDELLDEQEVVLKPLSQLLQRLPNVSGAAVLETGEICTILNPGDLVQNATSGGLEAIAPATTPTKTSLLLVEDSLVIRTQMKRILEGAGYEVTAAVNGLDGWNKLREGHFAAVISDVQMPELDGFGLTARIRQLAEYEELPVILVTTLADASDRRRGAEVGANAYITKGTFDQGVLLDTLARLV